MDRTSQGPGIPPAAGSPEEPTVLAERVVSVERGQRVQATVVAQDGDRIWFGYRGAVLEARTNVPLTVGATFEFVVAATSPRIELVQVRPGASAVAAGPAPTTAFAGDPFAALQAFVQALRDHSAAAAIPPALTNALAAWAAGDVQAPALLALDRLLGHRHEARLLHLHGDDAAAAAELRTDAKAIALASLVRADGGAGGAAAARTLVAALSACERDQAERAAVGAPTWLPLPPCPAMGLLEARMFVPAVDEREPERPAADGAQAFTVVLLLELTKLGPLRVDLVLRGERVAATFVAAPASTAAMLRGASAGLEARLQAAGLTVDPCRVHTAPGGVLPVADLLPPPRAGTALVDVHA